MADNTTEMQDTEINVEEIMENIREKIRRKRTTTEKLPHDLDTEILSCSTYIQAENSADVTQRDLSCMNSRWDITNNGYIIRSHHPYIGKFLIKGRQLVHGEVRRYVDPMISRQMEFNTSALRIITWASRRCAELDLRQQDMERSFSVSKLDFDKKIIATKLELNDLFKETVDTQIDELNRKVDTQIDELNRKVDTQIDEFNGKVDNRIEKCFIQLEKDIQARAWLAHVLEDRVRKELSQKSFPSVSPSKTNTNYFLFEERFRGSREDIKQRQLAFIQYFEECSNVLDIGCGRGEFLEILHNHNIRGKGIDIDKDMVTYCQSLNLTVLLSDAIEYLESIEDVSLDGIFIDQVVEHLESDYLIRLLDLCYRKLKNGCYIVVETVNPLSFFSFSNFFIDLTHKRPVHPQTLYFLLSSDGFRDIEVKYLAPVTEDSQLKFLTIPEESEEGSQASIDIYNHNIALLNSILFGPQDYAMIAKK